MKQEIYNVIRHISLLGLFLAITVLTGCNRTSGKFNFENPQQALNVCHSELSKIRTVEKATVPELANITSLWLELQDSTLSCFMRDSSVVNNEVIAEDFFSVSDSIRTEIIRLAFSDERTLTDVVQLKTMVASKNTTKESKDYKIACDFFSSLNNEKPYNSLDMTLKQYEDLLLNTQPFKKEQELLDFIKKEDRCFRSLLIFLKEVPMSRLQLITDRTSSLFDKLYKNTAANLDNHINSRVMIYLTMRFNRRIIQNANICRADIKKKTELTPQQSANYKWMLVQPYMTIDNYAMGLLTDDQIKDLKEIAKELPRLLVYIDGKDFDKSSKDEIKKLEGVLTEYIIKSYLKTNL